MASRGPILALLVCFAVVAAACDDPPQPATTTRGPLPPLTTTPPTSAPPTTTLAPPSPAAGGELIVAVIDEPPTLNPFLPGGRSVTARLIGEALHRGVQRVNADTRLLEADLVTELPTVDNGGVVLGDDGTMTVTYQIRPDAVWSDGEPVTGADFQFTLDLILDPAVPISKAVYEDIVDTEVTDTAFSYTLARPTPRHELLFSVLLPQHAVAGSDFLSEWNTTTWPSNGPYVLTEWRAGEFIRLERNPQSFRTDPVTGAALPYLDSVEFRFVPDSAAAVDALRIREADVIQPSFAGALVDELVELEQDGVVVDLATGADWEHLAFQFGSGNRNRESFNADRDFRRAVAHAIDRDAIVTELLGGKVAALDSWLAAHDGELATDAWAGYDFDPERAADLVAAACNRVGRDCVAEPPEVIFTASDELGRRRLDDRLERYLEDVGMAYESDLEVGETFLADTLLGGTWDLAAWAQPGSPGLAGAVSALDAWDPATPCPLGGNCARWGTGDSLAPDGAAQRFASLVAEANSTVDAADLAGIVQEAERLLAEEVVVIPLHLNPAVAAWWGDEVDGLSLQAAADGLTWNVETWFRTDR